MAERSPAAFARWLLNTETEEVKVLKTELSSEPLRTDSLVLLGTSQQILHIEFQTRPYSQPPNPHRMLEYKGRLIRQYGQVEICQIVIFLQFVNSQLVYQNQYRDQYTTHHYRVVRLWEEDPEPLLADPNLLPLASLARSNDPEALLAQAVQQIANIELREKRQDISSCFYVLAGLRFDKQLVSQLLRSELMQESVTYQEILQKGVQQGVRQGLQQGIQQGELAMLRYQLNRRFGVLSPQLEERLNKLSISQLEALGVAMFDFSALNDVMVWLQQYE